MSDIATLFGERFDQDIKLDVSEETQQFIDFMCSRPFVFRGRNAKKGDLERKRTKRSGRAMNRS